MGRRTWSFLAIGGGKVIGIRAVVGFGGRGL